MSSQPPTAVTVDGDDHPRVGLLGGSFDPIHLAHLALARTALRELALNQVQLIPAANPWQRAPLHVSAEHRLRMIELAIADQAGLAVNPIEIERGGATYTIDTLRALPSGVRYLWILGADQLANFCTWQDWQEIAERVELVVAVRPGTPLAPPPPLIDWLGIIGAQPIRTLAFSPMAISASDIRARLSRGDTTDGLLPPDVIHYISAHSLYQ